MITGGMHLLNGVLTMINRNNLCVCMSVGVLYLKTVKVKFYQC